MNYRHPGDYIDKRLGIARDNCDQTPCVCSKADQRLVRGGYKAMWRDYLRSGVAWDGSEDLEARELEYLTCAKPCCTDN